MSDILKEQIINIIRKADVIVDPTSLRTDIKLSEQGIDSLSLFNILLLIDETFKISIPDEDIDRLQTINDIVEYIESKT